MMMQKTAERIANEIINVVNNVVMTEKRPLVLHEPEFSENEKKYVNDCIDTGWVSSAGPYVNKFETALAEYTGASYAVATVNGTAALHIALLLSHVKLNDEVLLPSLTFVATANAVSYCGAIPHFVDSAIDTLGIDPETLDRYIFKIADFKKGKGLVNKSTGRFIKALIPMHTFGHPVDLDGIKAVCDRYEISLVEDAAESLGSTYKGLHTGRYGKMAALSFNGNKIVTTGGGGAILTDDAELAKQAKHLSTTARETHPWAVSHDEIGFNYRMPNINAALGCAQLEKMPDFIRRKRLLADRYKTAFSKMLDINFVHEPKNSVSNYWLNAILLHPDQIDVRDKIISLIINAGILVRPCWKLMHNLPMYSQCPRAPLPVAESIEKRLINLPSSACLV